MAGGGSSSSQMKTTTTPGAWGNLDYSKSSSIGDQILGLVGQGGTTSPLYNKLMSAIDNPQYSPTTATGKNLIDDLMTQTGAKSAVNGLGAPTQSSLASTIAPTLQNMQQQYVSNLQGQQQTGISALLQALGYAMPQVVAGNESKGWNFKVL